MNVRIERACAAISLLLLATPLIAREDYTRDFDKTLSMSSGQRLRIVHRLGNVRVRTQAKGELSIHAVIRVSASNETEAKRFAESIHIEVEPSGNEVLIETHYPKQERSTWFRNISYSARYDILMPETSPLEINNSFGAVSVSDAKAGADIRNSHGKLEFRNGRGPVRLENAFAPVEVTGNAGELTLTNTNGNVEIRDVSGAIRVKDRFATVVVSHTGGGTINNGNGSVEVSQIDGDLRVTTSFAGVHAENIKGNLTVNNQNGKVTAVGVSGSASIETSFASVEASDVRKGIQ